MKRIILASSLTLAVLFGGSVLGILWATRRVAPPSMPEPPAVAEGPPSAPETAPPPRPPPAGPKGGAPRGRWTPRGEDPSAVPMASRVTRKSLRKALHAPEIQERLARCAGDGGGFGRGAGRRPAPRAQPAVLLLDVEARPGELRIVGTNIRSWGGASAGAVRCAQDALEGRTFPAEGSEAEGRFRMPLPLTGGPGRSPARADPAGPSRTRTT